MCNEIRKHVVIKIFNIMRLRKRNETHVEFITNYLREILINERVINAIDIQKSFCFQYKEDDKSS